MRNFQTYRPNLNRTFAGRLIVGTVVIVFTLTNLNFAQPAPALPSTLPSTQPTTRGTPRPTTRRVPVSNNPRDRLPFTNASLTNLKPGDFVVIEFGHNSGPLPGIGEETAEVAGRAGGATTTMHTHGWYLRKFIADVRAKNATPIASTITLRNYWKDGKVERLKEQTPGLGGMSDWTRQVAAAEKVLLVDHSNIIGDRYDALGKDAVAKFFDGTEYLHTNTAGAVVNCEAFIAGLKAIPDMPLVNDLNEKGRGIEAYKPAK